MKIYTKTGDRGQTSLFSGQRVNKSDGRVRLYGAVDELNSQVGFLLSLIIQGQKNYYQSSKRLTEQLKNIQSNLFVMGSWLATVVESKSVESLPSWDRSFVAHLEKAIDDWQEQLPALANFILPGGSTEASSSHLCRVVCRRLEADLCYFVEEQRLEPYESFIVYLNRLSDYFFVVARVLNKELNVEEFSWP